MYRQNGKFVYSPSDLTTYMESPFASWVSRYVIECPEQAPNPDVKDALMGTLQTKGYAHEDALVEQFRARGLNVVEITAKDKQMQHSDTLAAMQDGVDVVFQALLSEEPFQGYADFLVRVPGESKLGDFHYEVWDTKLSSRVKPKFLIQLCCYADLLEGIQGVRPANLTVALGNGQLAEFTTQDFFFYYKSMKRAFLDDQANFDVQAIPDPADSTAWGKWGDYAQQILLDRDHLSQVATITRSQIKRFNRAGIETVQQLIDMDDGLVPGLTRETAKRLKAQASVQRASEGLDRPHFEVLRPELGRREGLALLPPASPQDVFFDIEGYPLDEGGLEYLWGNTYFDEQGQRHFVDFWAHNREQEKQCFQDFIGWVYGRWQKDTSMHIYHYANYEIAACRKLMGRYGVCEYEVDQLLRNEVFVDLYKVVKGGILLGEPRYSIKNVEHLYRGKRETDVGNGGDSVVVYESFREQFLTDHPGQEPSISVWKDYKTLSDIRDYNIDDCDSTQELVDWLRIQQGHNDISYIGKTEVDEPELSEEITDRTALRDKLLARAETEEEEGLQEQATLSTNLAWSLEFHRREAKPAYWKLFDRLGLSHDELMDDLDCLACCERTDTAAFKPTPRARNLAYEYRFNQDQEFKGKPGSFYLLGEGDPADLPPTVKMEVGGEELERGIVNLIAKVEPPSFLTLVPNEHVRPHPIPMALQSQVGSYFEDDLGQCAILDFLGRSVPRIKNHTSGEPIVKRTDSESRLQQVIEAIVNLDYSYLAIQGPPGSGKTFTGKHVIAELMRLGKRVGICSNSHKAINNLLIGTAEYCRSEGIHSKFACTKETDDELKELDVAILSNGDLSGFVGSSCVMGTTAWGFSRDDMAEQLDYLFIDEAGQVSVVNLIAISQATKNLVLMGDQMQLGQPTQGTHPADSGLSILDYLLHGQPTIPDSMGVFLGTTYRMHSAVNRFISDAIYEGKLASDEDNDRQVVAVPDGYQGPLNRPAGITYLPVIHQGNTQASDEEVDEIICRVKELLGRRYTDKTGRQEAIQWRDILFVAPYNHQVNKLKRALSILPGGEQAKVGSVDKFQGQEAPIVFLSMCASDASESPRGLEFLLDKNRMNVAISRAQSLAIVVGSPGLVKASAANANQMSMINLYARLISYGSQ